MPLTFTIDDDHPLIALVTLKETGEIIDAERITYRYSMDNVCERHDMSKVEITYKAARSTAQFVFKEPVVEPPARPPLSDEDDVPF